MLGTGEAGRVGGGEEGPERRGVEQHEAAHEVGAVCRHLGRRVRGGGAGTARWAAGVNLVREGGGQGRAHIVRVGRKAEKGVALKAHRGSHRVAVRREGGLAPVPLFFFFFFLMARKPDSELPEAAAAQTCTPQGKSSNKITGEGKGLARMARKPPSEYGLTSTLKATLEAPLPLNTHQDGEEAAQRVARRVHGLAHHLLDEI